MRHPVKTGLAIAALSLAAHQLPAHSQQTLPSPLPAVDGRLFAVEVRTGPNWDHGKAPAEQAQFREHSAHLKKLRDAGHIVVGARYSDKGLLVFTAGSATEVKALMDLDPSMSAGTFRYEIHEFNVFYSGALQGTPRR